MKTLHKTVAALALVAPVIAGCATHGYVDEHIAAAQLKSDSAEARMSAAIVNEHSERVAADSQLAGQVAALRKDLDSLRSEFGAKITAMDDGMHFDLPVHFAFDDATVRDEDRAALDKFAKVAQKYYPTSIITVEGFADPAGSKSYNVALSQRRADAVKDYLGGQGLSDVKTVGYGKTRFVVPKAQKDDPGAELNRRVVFVIESKDRGPAGVASIGQ